VSYCTVRRRKKGRTEGRKGGKEDSDDDDATDRAESRGIFVNERRLLRRRKEKEWP